MVGLKPMALRLQATTLAELRVHVVNGVTTFANFSK